MEFTKAFNDFWGYSSEQKQLTKFLSVTALILYAMTKIIFPHASSIFEILFVASAIIVFFTKNSWRDFISSPIFLFFLAAIFVQLFPWINGKIEPSVFSTENPYLDRLTKIMLFWFPAIILAGKTRNVLIYWSLATLSLLAFLLLPMHWESWRLGLSGVRIDFGIRNAQHIGMFFGVITLGCICFFKRVFQNQNKLLILFWLTVFLLSVSGIFVTQTRAIFVGLIFPLTLLTLYEILFSPHKYKILACTIGLVLIFSFFDFKFFDGIKNRYKQEEQVIIKLVNGDWNNIPYTSVGIRANTWLVALDKIEERPIFGWGSKSRSLVIKTSTTLPDYIKKEFGHLHNYFLEVALGYGFVGLFFILSIFGYFILKMMDLAKDNKIDNDVFIFSILFIIYFLIVNNFESYLSFWTGIYITNIVFGGLASFILYRDDKHIEA